MKSSEAQPDKSHSISDKQQETILLKAKKQAPNLKVQVPDTKAIDTKTAEELVGSETSQLANPFIELSSPSIRIQQSNQSALNKSNLNENDLGSGSSTVQSKKLQESRAKDSAARKKPTPQKLAALQPKEDTTRHSKSADKKREQTELKTKKSVTKNIKLVSKSSRHGRLYFAPAGAVISEPSEGQLHITYNGSQYKCNLTVTQNCRPPP